jgi:NADPH:quinone reductase-like Zn-dependent oxidoreductase
VDGAEGGGNWGDGLDPGYVIHIPIETRDRQDILTREGTGGVSLFALKLARAAGLRVILSSSSDDKLKRIAGQFSTPPISTVNYQNQNWHEEVLKLTNGVGVDVVVEVGGNGSVVQSVKCTRRGGIVSSVGYLSGNETRELKELLPTLIDRRVNLRQVNFLWCGCDKADSLIGALMLDPRTTWMIFALLCLLRRYALAISSIRYIRSSKLTRLLSISGRENRLGKSSFV